MRAARPLQLSPRQVISKDRRDLRSLPFDRMQSIFCERKAIRATHVHLRRVSMQKETSP